MNKMLIINRGGIMEQISDGPPPYTDVRLVDCDNGERGDVFVFDSGWRDLLNQTFGKGLIPHYIQIDEAEIEPALNDRAQMLLQRVTADIAELRRISQDPFMIPFDTSGELGIELRPIEEDDRVTVSCRFMGDTVVNYGEEGLVIDVFSADRALLEPLKSMWFDASDLSERATEDSEGKER